MEHVRTMENFHVRFKIFAEAILDSDFDEGKDSDL